MSEEALIPFLAVFVGTGLLFIVGWYFTTARLARRRQRRERRLSGASDSDVDITLVDTLPGRRPATRAQRFDRWFAEVVAKTGLDMDTSLALALIVFSGVLPAVIVFIWRFDEEPWLAVPTLFVGMAIPFVFFVWRQRVWRRTMQNQLPDVFFLLARSLRAGRSIDQSMQLVGEQGVPPLSREFARMSRQMELGLPLHEVLQLGAKRLQLVDFNVFSSVITLHRSTGGNLPLILDRLASATRDHNHFEGQYRAATVLGRYSAAFIFSLALFILFYFFFQREMALRFFDSTTGIWLFSLAMAMEVLGLVWLFWLLRQEY
jgi:Flp pilus assembly protein TadB